MESSRNRRHLKAPPRATCPSGGVGGRPWCSAEPVFDGDMRRFWEGHRPAQPEGILASASRALSPDAPGELHVLGHDGHAATSKKAALEPFRK
eukprot:scaffold33561_cov112-Isochrysis_galbana.AAC.2